MAEELSNITNRIIQDVQADEILAQVLTSDSKTSVWRRMVFVVAKAIWLLQNMFDNFRTELETEMAKQKIHSKQWYRQKAIDFLFGFSVIAGTDKFDTSGATDEEIAAAKVVKQAACIKMISSSGYGILRVKVATEDSDGNLQKLPTEQYEALKYYFMRYAVDAGTQLRVTTGDADDLLLKLDVYYDPLVISTTGARLDGTADTPVLDAINQYLKSLEFNGALYVSDLIAAIRQVDGVRLAKCLEARSKYGAYDYNADVINAGLIDEIRVADSGYMKIDESNLQINYKVMPE